jgi:ribosomal protein L7Ae-like RNA K-turn-binding protein
MTAEDIGKLLSCLGLARRANELLIGQDRIFSAIRRGQKLLAVASEDCSDNVLRKARAASCDVMVISGLRGESLGAAIGALGAKIAALPLGSGFTKKILELSKRERRRCADE